MNIDQKEYKELKKFNFYQLTNFPFIEQTFDSMTTYELICKLGESTNNLYSNQEAVQYNMTQVYTFTKNYFDNLDVQEEINNKLDEMYNDGQLTEIINNIFASINARVDSTIEALETLGTTVSENNTNTNNKINTEITRVEGLIETATTNLSGEISEVENTLNTKIDRKHITVIIGDSYSSNDSGSVTARDGSTSWVEAFREISDNIIINVSDGGAGFVRKGLTTNLDFAEQFSSVITDEDIDKSLIDTIIIYGGCNDIDNGVSASSVIGGATTLNNLIKEHTPKAKVFLAYANLGVGIITIAKATFIQNVINETCKFGWNYNKCVGWLHGENGKCWATDKYHPNQFGAERILSCMVAFLNGTEGTIVPVSAPNLLLENGTPVNLTAITNSLYYDPLNAKLHGCIYYDTSTTGIVVSGNTFTTLRADIDVGIQTEVNRVLKANYAATNYDTRITPYLYSFSTDNRLQIGIMNSSGTQNTILGIIVDAEINYI